MLCSSSLGIRRGISEQMLQHYGVGKIIDIILDVTTLICITSQDNSVTYSRPGARAVCLGGGTKKVFGGTHFVNSIDKRFIKNNTKNTVRPLEAHSLDLSCCFIEERLW